MNDSVFQDCILLLNLFTYLLIYLTNVCLFIVCVGCMHTGVTINVAVGIAVVVTGTITFVVGVLTGVLLYHCISKHRSQLKPESSSHQQQQTDPEYEAVPATSGKEKFELRENIAYEPVQH